MTSQMEEMVCGPDRKLKRQPRSLVRLNLFAFRRSQCQKQTSLKQTKPYCKFQMRVARQQSREVFIDRDIHRKVDMDISLTYYSTNNYILVDKKRISY